MISTDVFVIGAGMAGLTLAQQLKRQGKQVVCVDKARGSGGRLSSKRVQGAEHAVSFDLGALSFSATTHDFKKAVNHWCDQQYLAPWLQSDNQIQYVGTPRSSSLTRALADDVDAQFDVRISAIIKNENGWSIFREENEKDVLFAYANEIVLASPAPQTYALIPDGNPLKSTLKDVTIFPQWVAMLALEKPLSIPNLHDAPNDNLARISYENSKPKRNNDHGLHVYCVQASQQWSEKRLDYSKDKVVYELADELSQLCAEPLLIKSDYAHRWLYSKDTNFSYDAKGFLSSDDGLFICGDYLLSNVAVDGVEAAYLSGCALAKHMNNSYVELTLG
jgi:predicted NAD/FAD-dependent oxidoreductase